MFGMFILLIIFFFVLTMGAIAMRSYGWEAEKNTPKKNWVIGIDGVGGLLLIVAFVLTGGAFVA